MDRQLQDAGRSAWTREARQQYDAALLYHDGVLSDLLKSLREGAGSGTRAAWMYLSDHGQEVGHELDRAGHSATTAAGYRIPALIWRSEPADAAAAQRPFRADWAAWTVADLLGLQWPGQDATRNVLDPGYRWQPPRLDQHQTLHEDDLAQQAEQALPVFGHIARGLRALPASATLMVELAPQPGPRRR